MVKITTTKDRFQRYIKVSKKHIVLHLNETEKDGVIECDELAVKLSGEATADKATLVSTMINTVYPTDLMDAVRNNMDAVRDGLIEDAQKAEEYREEYLKMQSWRAEAKRIAEEIIGV